MKFNLGTKYGCGPMHPMDMGKEDEKEYPSLMIYLNDDNKGLLEALKKTGTAKVTFSVKSKEIIEGEDSDRKGNIVLKIESIEIGKTKDEASKDSEEALNDFMKDKE